MKEQNLGSPMSLAALLKGDQYINSVVHSYQHHDVFLDGSIGDPSEYRELISLLFNAGDDDVFNLIINSEGGQLDTAMAIIEGLKNTPAKVTAVLVGACHSAASIISMYCDEVIVLDSAYSMVHTASFGSVGTAGNVKLHTEFTVRQVEKILAETYEGFLTKEEMAQVKAGVELWFDAEDIKQRMTKRVQFFEAKQKAAERKDNAAAKPKKKATTRPAAKKKAS